MSVRPQVFVAMSFAETYSARFNQVIAPAIRDIRVNDAPLEPYRVDFSKSGDSILTDIMDGIAHCQLFLADVSVVGHDSISGSGYRNGNVMYEVGLALACRQTTEVLLVRDDKERFLFDVSTIPHLHLDFANHTKARQELQEQIIGRLRERNFLLDARVQRASASLTNAEIQVIEECAKYKPPNVFGYKETGSVNFLTAEALPRLCDKNVIRLVAKWEGGGAAYQWTELGYSVATLVTKHIPSLKGDDPAPTPPAPASKAPGAEAVESTVPPPKPQEGELPPPAG
jgi:hypothetical protein